MKNKKLYCYECCNICCLVGFSEKIITHSLFKSQPSLYLNFYNCLVIWDGFFICKTLCFPFFCLPLIFWHSSFPCFSIQHYFSREVIHWSLVTWCIASHMTVMWHDGTVVPEHNFKGFISRAVSSCLFYLKYGNMLWH